MRTEQLQQPEWAASATPVTAAVTWACLVFTRQCAGGVAVASSAEWYLCATRVPVLNHSSWGFLAVLVVEQVLTCC